MFENATRKRCVALGLILLLRPADVMGAVVFEMDRERATGSSPNALSVEKCVSFKATLYGLERVNHAGAGWKPRHLPNWPGRNEPSADRFHRLSVIRRESGLVAIPKLPELRARKVRGSGLFGGR